MCRSEKAAVCLLPNSCLGIAVRILAKFESNEVGLTWDKASSSPSADDDFSFSWVLGMFVIQSLFYAVITWYDDMTLFWFTLDAWHKLSLSSLYCSVMLYLLIIIWLMVCLLVLGMWRQYFQAVMESLSHSIFPSQKVTGVDFPMIILCKWSLKR